MIKLFLFFPSVFWPWEESTISWCTWKGSSSTRTGCRIDPNTSKHSKWDFFTLLVDVMMVCDTGCLTHSHLVFAPSQYDTYSSSSFAGLTDLLESVGDQTAEQNPTEWAKIKKHLSVIAFHVEAAANSLSDSLWWTNEIIDSHLLIHL